MNVQGPKGEPLLPLSLPVPFSLAKAAQFYAEHGTRVHPLYGVLPNGTCRCHAANSCPHPGKHPHVRRWPVEATTNPSTVRRWWYSWPQANIGAPVPTDNLVFDIDPQSGGDLNALGPLPATRIVRTGSGGWHIFLQLPEHFSLEHLHDRIHVPGAPGIDLRTKHNYTVLPPSCNAAGHYSWETPFDHPIAVIPEELLLRVAAWPTPQPNRLKQWPVTTSISDAETKTKPAKESPSQRLSVPSIKAGQRNNALFRLACSLRARGVADGTVEAAVRTENTLRCSPPLSDDEVQQLLLSSCRYPPNQHEILGELQEYRIRGDEALVRVLEHDASGESRSDREFYVAPLPLRLTARIVDEDSKQQFLRVAWREDGRWHEHVAERETIMNVSKLVGLSAFGLPVHSANARAIMEYFARYEHVNRPHLPVEHITATLGWHEQRRVYLWGSQAIGSSESTLRFAPRGSSSGRGGDGGDAQLSAGLHWSGAFGEWTKMIARMAPFPKALFAIYGALAAPLLSHLEVPTFFINWHSRTSLGKTTTLLAAASVCGKPDGPEGLLQSWNTTQVNLERLCSVCNDLPVFLDDAKSGSVANIGALIYKIASGVGKGRGTITGRAGLDHWRTIILSTGEGRLVDSTSDGGAHGRVLELSGAPFVHGDQAALVTEIKAGVRTNFGFALPHFVSYLQQHREEADTWRMLHSKLRERLARGHSNVADRLAEYFAAVCITAELFHRSCQETGRPLPWPTPEFHEIWPELVSATVQADTDVRALHHLFSWVQSHQESFYGRHLETQDGSPRVPAAGWSGKWENIPDWDEIAISPHVLAEVLQRAGYNDVEAIKRAWRERGWRRMDSEGRDPQVRWRESERERSRLVMIQRSAVRAVEGEV